MVLRSVSTKLISKSTTTYNIFLLMQLTKNVTSGNRLNHCMLLHVHCKKTDQLNIVVGDNQAKLQTFDRFREH